MKTPPIVTVHIWCTAMNIICWKCQCGEAHTATPATHFTPRGKRPQKLTALQEAEIQVIRHIEERHQGHQLQWKTLQDKPEENQP